MNLVSVILPVYNVEKYLRKAVDSVLSQTYENLEIILVDDGSTDSSGALCEDYANRDNRILVVHKPNGGLASARNAGLCMAHGEYIAYIDSDDWVEPDFIESLLRACIEYGAAMSICRYRDAYDEEPIKQTEEDFEAVWTGKEAVAHRVLDEEKYKISTCAWNKFYKKALVADMSFPEGKYYEDIVYGVQAILRAEKVVYINRSLYNYRCNRPESIMNQGFTSRVVTDEMPLMCERNRLIREAGLTEIADLVDRNYCIRAMEIYRELYCWKSNEPKEPYERICVEYLQKVYDRCGHQYFKPIDKLKMHVFNRSKQTFVFLSNLKH